MKTHDSNTKVRVYLCRNAMQTNPGHPLLARLQSAGVIVEPVPCGGRIDPRYLLKAFESGADAVCVLTCSKTECKRMEGNLRATRRVQVVRDFLAEAGMDPSALRIFMADGPGADALDAVMENIVRFVETRHAPERVVT